MASVVGICNRGLQKLGAKEIVDLDEDSVNARACNLAYEPIRLALLRAHPWSCAIKRFNIAADDPAPAFGYTNSFTVPSDFLRLLPPDVDKNTDTLDWKIEGNKIMTNDSAPLQGRYIADITDPNLMDPLLREAISSKMGLELCEKLTQSNQKKADLKLDFKDAIAEARRTNAIEKTATVTADDSWVACRNR